MNYFMRSNSRPSIRISAEHKKLSPDTTRNKRSGRIKRLYKKVMPEHTAQIMYDLVFALFLLWRHKSLIVGIYPIVAIMPTLA